MKGSAKSKYGLQFMVGLALRFGHGPSLVATIADQQGLPPKFMRVLLGDLKAAGLISVQRGPNGGCELARHPSHITTLEVIEALEGPLSPPRAPADAPFSAQAVNELWARSVAAARHALHRTTLADLVARQQALEVDSHGYSI